MAGQPRVEEDLRHLCRFPRACRSLKYQARESSKRVKDPLPEFVDGKGWGGVQSTGVRELGSTGVREFGSSGVQEFGSSGVREFRSSGVREFGSSGVREFGSH